MYDYMTIEHDPSPIPRDRIRVVLRVNLISDLLGTPVCIVQLLDDATRRATPPPRLPPCPPPPGSPWPSTSAILPPSSPCTHIISTILQSVRGVPSLSLDLSDGLLPDVHLAVSSHRLDVVSVLGHERDEPVRLDCRRVSHNLALRSCQCLQFYPPSSISPYQRRERDCTNLERHPS